MYMVKPTSANPLQSAISSFIYMNYDLMLKRRIFIEALNANSQEWQVIPAWYYDGEPVVFVVIIVEMPAKHFFYKDYVFFCKMELIQVSTYNHISIRGFNNK